MATHYTLQSLFNLKGRVSIVIGGAGLLGQQFAEALAEFGSTVVIADIDGKKAESASRVIARKFRARRIIGQHVNLESPDSITGLFREVARRFKRIDVLVNSAQALPDGNFQTFETASPSTWDKIARVNLTGTYLSCQSVLPYMMKQKHGSIINLGSTYGMVGACQEIYGRSGINSPAVYAATKGGVINLTRYLAVYLAKYGIRVNSISPGGVFNHQPEEFVKNYAARTPLKRMARPHEMKGAVLYLASDASSYSTGHNLVVDGGWTAW